MGTEADNHSISARGDHATRGARMGGGKEIEGGGRSVVESEMQTEAREKAGGMRAEPGSVVA
jgi:hypothetical protein